MGNMRYIKWKWLFSWAVLLAGFLALAVSVSAAMNPIAQKAMEQIPKLKGVEAHSTVILASRDESLFKKFGVNITCEPQYQTKKLYHK